MDTHLATASLPWIDGPAVRSALASLEAQQDAGHGDEDFSTVVVNR